MIKQIKIKAPDKFVKPIEDTSLSDDEELFAIRLPRGVWQSDMMGDHEEFATKSLDEIRDIIKNYFLDHLKLHTRKEPDFSDKENLFLDFFVDYYTYLHIWGYFDKKLTTLTYLFFVQKNGVMRFLNSLYDSLLDRFNKYRSNPLFKMCLEKFKNEGKAPVDINHYDIQDALRKIKPEIRADYFKSLKIGANIEKGLRKLMGIVKPKNELFFKSVYDYIKNYSDIKDLFDDLSNIDSSSFVYCKYITCLKCVAYYEYTFKNNKNMSEDVLSLVNSIRYNGY